jgi:hypothetical protein
MVEARRRVPVLKRMHDMKDNAAIDVIADLGNVPWDLAMLARYGDAQPDSAAYHKGRAIAALRRALARLGAEE